LPPEITTFLRGCSPYKGGDNTLWAFNYLCNTKKHCALVPTRIGKTVAFFTRAIPGVLVSEIVSPNSSALGGSPAKNEFILEIAPSGEKTDVTVQFAFGVSIEGLDVLGDTQAGHALLAMCDIVERILMATEAECRRLGFQIVQGGRHFIYRTGLSVPHGRKSSAFPRVRVAG